MFDILKDTEIVEGIVGAIAFGLIIWYFRSYLKWSRVKSAGFIFPIVWIVRKVGVNVYNFIKNSKGLSIETVKTTKF
jgi:hypothetical protein